ncbi:MAG: rubredoxin [Desulfobacula sp.]|nr:rubredoxin [Desulfobacula sp.]
MRVWQCTVCKYIHKGDKPPQKCPVCGVDASKFVEIDEASIPEKRPPKRTPESATASDSKKSAKAAVKEVKPPPKPEDTTVFEIIQSLLVKHHAHPVSVHTPNGILPMVVILYILAWLFDVELLAKAAMIGQVFVVISLPLVIYTGTLEWRKKYGAALTTIFKQKMLAAALTTAICVITLSWYLIDPTILSSSKAGVFIILNVLMITCAGIAGHIGGKFVFKD